MRKFSRNGYILHIFLFPKMFPELHTNHVQDSSIQSVLLARKLYFLQYPCCLCKEGLVIAINTHAYVLRTCEYGASMSRLTPSDAKQILTSLHANYVNINPRRACAKVTVLGLSVCLCVCFSYSGTSRNQAYKQQYQRLKRDTGMKYKNGFFLKTLRSEVMASFAYRDSPRLHSSALELAFSTTKYSKVV